MVVIVVPFSVICVHHEDFKSDNFRDKIWDWELPIKEREWNPLDRNAECDLVKEDDCQDMHDTWRIEMRAKLWLRTFKPRDNK